MARVTLAAGAGLAALLAGCATTPPSAPAPLPDVYDDPAVARLVAPRLETFESDEAFIAYLNAVRDTRNQRDERERALSSQQNEGNAVVVPAPSPTDFLVPEPLPPSLTDAASNGYAAASESDDQVTVTGSRIAASETTPNTPLTSLDPQNMAEISEELITNVQTLGVDEGDIVKRIGDYLVVLQDGRLFSIDLRPDGEEGLEFAARTNVYRADNEDTWYDEMLVFGDRIVITGYSYREYASEFSVFTLNEDGSFSRDGVFYMSSDDYYDVENYATRIIGDTLVMHTPIYLDTYTRYDLEDFDWPTVRVWREEDPQTGRDDDEAQFFNATQIHRPLTPTLEPTLHTVSFCSLSPVGDGEGPACEATAFVGPSAYEFYVSAVDAWIWTGPHDEEIGGPPTAPTTDCERSRGVSPREGRPGAIYRIPLTGGEMSVAASYGDPQDHFAFRADENVFNALLAGPSDVCDKDTGPSMSLAQIPLRRFSNRLRSPVLRDYNALPPSGAYIYENRFVGDYLVYAGRDNFQGYPPELGASPQAARLIVAPLEAPRDAATLETPHDVIRMERLGGDVLVTGYRDANGLSLSTIALSDDPRVADTAVLQNRYETEGRSHAFNARVHRDGSALMGLPTSYQIAESGRWWWRSDQSDLSFLTTEPDLSLDHVGELVGVAEEHESYRCEVSCVDWYGNSRPLFLDGRILALSGTELIEGRLADGRITAIRRVNLTAPLGNQD